MKALVVDDQPSARHMLMRLLKGLPNLESVEADSLAAARAALALDAFDLAFIDLRLADDVRNRDGLVLLEEICRNTTTTPVVISGFSDYAELRQAFRIGAADYLLKDGVAETLRPTVERIREQRRLQQEVVDLRARARGLSAPAGLIGGSRVMAELRETIRRVAASDKAVLIHGPTGAGKELVAQAIHALGPRPHAPLQAVNSGGLAASLVESELFGHVRGAFTDAVRDKEGRLTTVADGTLFLDEVGELPMELQPKLLRVLENRTFTIVGDTKEQTFRGRVVAATHVDLAAAVAEKRFRADLHFRLAVLPIRVPSLDERREDIPALIAHFASRQQRPLRFADGAIALLSEMPWQGNVRELRSVIDRIAVLCDADVIGADHVRAIFGDLDPGEDVARRFARQLLGRGEGDKLALAKRILVDEAMLQTGGNKSAAGELLGVHRRVIERAVVRNGNGHGDDDAP